MPSTQKPIVVVGSINIDFVVTAERMPLPGETVMGKNFQVHPGGKGANQAVAASRLGYPVQMVGKVGTDVFGQQLRMGLQEAGCGVGAVAVAEGPSGVASITVSSSGENAIVVAPGANAQVSPEYLELHSGLIRSAGMVLTQLEIPIETVEYLTAFCARHDVPLMLDPAPAQVLPKKIFPQVSWLTPNETEALFFAEQIDGSKTDAGSSQLAQVFLNMGTPAVALKMGAKGVLLRWKEGSADRLLPAFAAQAVDSTAAGDAFNGAFATGLMLGMEAGEAAQFACAAASISVTRHGAQASMPSRAEVAKVLGVHA